MSRIHLTALLLACALPAAALTPEELFEKASRSVFVVHTYDKDGRRLASGSGVVTGQEQIITNCHVLAKSTSIRVSRGNASFGATLEFPDPERDLCQLRVKDLSAPAVPLGSIGSVRIGQRVYAIGAPLGLELTLSDGLVSSLRGDDGNTPLIQTTAPISPGSSGGGLFDASGNLIGITTFGGRRERQLNFAHPADWIRELPERGAQNLAKLKERNPKPSAAVPARDVNLPAGMPQVGDTWTYVGIDQMFRPGEISRKAIHTVRSVSKDLVVESVDGLDISFSSEVIAHFRGSAMEIAPFMLAFRDLKPGDQLRGIKIHGVENMKGGNAWGIAPNEDPYYIYGGEVLGPEKVTVRAGTFDAIAVRYRGMMHGALNTRGRGGLTRGPDVDFTLTIWYAPAVRRAVKSVMLAPRAFQEIYELESYTLR